ncbi:hypothetical protein P691DRAFT_678320 [Macrolepiota fuliginosa MF-IS2]|uniref:Uncharacterized protein n=1 Tax=Macrolepiota fuliginosa MF-IS2 TaxID=1400762 RepID=A0A9P6BXI8_9AGAR|nr:hypothetical protein P691DRAFT_678320 [Macrolepiota fuliginosa MF-IS2]
MPPPPFSSSSTADFPHRPMTARPGTAAGDLADYDVAHVQNPHHYTADYHIEEEYDEDESDDDDVFAFLPPSTAEEHQPAQRQHDEQHDPAFASYPPPTTASQQQNVAYPSPTYNPYGQGKYPYDETVVAAAAASSSSSHQFGFDPSYGYPQNTILPAQPANYTLHPAPQSPPSTDSHNHNNDDPYRMKRLNAALSSALPPSSAESHPSRQVRVSLPSSVVGVEHDPDAIEKATVDCDADIESLPHHSHQPGHQGRIRHGNLNSAPYSHGRSTRGNTATSGVDTISIGPSVLDDDDIDGTSREGSIK